MAQISKTKKKREREIKRKEEVDRIVHQIVVCHEIMIIREPLLALMRRAEVFQRLLMLES